MESEGEERRKGRGESRPGNLSRASTRWCRCKGGDAVVGGVCTEWGAVEVHESVLDQFVDGPKARAQVKRCRGGVRGAGGVAHAHMHTEDFKIPQRLQAESW